MRVFQEYGRYLSSLICAVVLLLGCFEARSDGVGREAGDTPSEVLPSGDVNDLDWDLANAFEFVWDSVQLSVKVSNPQSSAGADSGLPVLVLSGRVGILDRSSFITLDVNTVGVWELLDNDGRALECENAQTGGRRAYQEYGWYWHQGFTYTPQKWFPFTMTIQLSTDPNNTLPSSIAVVGGYIYALCADDVIDVDVPFDPNYGCQETEAVPDLVICVDPTTPPLPEPIEYVSPSSSSSSSGQRVIDTSRRPKNAIALYSYTTWVKSNVGSPVLGINDPPYLSSRVAFGDYAVIRTELFSSARRVSAILQMEGVLGDISGSRGAKCCGKEEQIYGDNYDMIRHVIAVRPVEVKIPFVLTNIPVPRLQAAAK
ncbi:MAG: hypothetical protein GXY19_04080 [Phycisphaerae bacterium]|nr:hypothetical protein [Phycisphaerae bacterium]